MKEPIEPQSKETSKRHGPPANGEFSLVYETTTDVQVGVNVQISKAILAETPDDASLAAVVRKPNGENFRFDEFDRFCNYLKQEPSFSPQTLANIPTDTLRQYWNQWFGLVSDIDTFSPIQTLFISTGMLIHIKSFQGGLSLEHLPIGLKKVPAANSQGKFDVVFDPPRQGQQQDPFAIPMMDLASDTTDNELTDDAAKQTHYAELLRTLTPAQKRWWERLLARHDLSVGADDKLSLMLSFRAFIKRIEAHGLSFDNAQLSENSFNDVTDMRTAMANMLTIVTHVAVRGHRNPRYSSDVQTQWTYIADLSLASNGAIRAVYQQPPLGVILPIMNINVSNYTCTNQPDKYSLCGYRAKTKDFEKNLTDNLDALSDKDFETHFFRTIAEQEHRYSMAFYLQAANKIREFSLFQFDGARQKHIQRTLFQLLLRTTTGTAHFCSLSESEALEQWTSILSLFQNFPIPSGSTAVFRVAVLALGRDLKKEIPDRIINDFYALSNSPSLNELHRLSKLLVSFMPSLSVTELNELGGKLSVDMDYLNQFGDKFFGQAVYDGMQFIDLDSSVKTYDESSFHRYITTIYDFINAMKFTKANLPIQHSDPDEKRFPLYLIKLISTFNLNIANLIELNVLIYPVKSRFGPNHAKQLEEWTLALKTLTEIKWVTNKSGHRLNADDLKRFLIDFNETMNGFSPNQNNDQLISQAVQTHFNEHYPADYFLSKIPESVIDWCSHEFEFVHDRHGVLEFIQQLRRSGQTINYGAIVSQIKQIVTPMQAMERSRFIAQLNQLLPPDKEHNAPQGLSDQVENLLKKLTLPDDGEKHRRAFSLFLDLKKKLPKHQQKILLDHSLLPSLMVWLDHHLDIETSIKSQGLPRVHISELSVRFILNNVPLIHDQLISIQDDLKKVLGIYADILQQFPAVSKNLWTFLQQYQDISLSSPTVLNQAAKDFHLLEEAFSLLTPPQVMSLCFHFDGCKQEGLLAERTPLRLIKILRQILKEKFFHEDDERTLLSMMVALLNQEKGMDIARLEEMINSIDTDTDSYLTSGNKPFLLQAIERCYSSVPYPGFSTFLTWCKDTNLESLEENRKTFSHRPCRRETGRSDEKKGEYGYKNGFHLEEARKIIIEGLEITESELGFLAQYTNEVREWTSDELLAKLVQYKHLTAPTDEITKNQRLAALVAITAELLYKIKSIESEKMGSSYEINTTQYLAIYAGLKTGGLKNDVISEIGTGEGKSRCISLVNACGLAQGKTVVCLTGSIELATRDYLEYSAFYQFICNGLGVSAKLIDVNSPIEQFSQGGLHISEVSHFQRFCNKANVIGKRDQVLNSDATKRMLTIDEADLLRLHHNEAKYVLSSAPDPDWQKMPLIYDAVMDFFAQDDGQANPTIGPEYLALTDNEPDAFLAFDKRFLTFVQTSYPQMATDLNKLYAQKPERFDELYRGAYQARQLAYQTALGFGIEADVIQDLPTGPAQYSVAFPMADKVAKFSMGIQQCLSVRLNRYYAILKKSQQTPSSLSEWEKTLLVKEKELFASLSQCDTSFFVGSQKQAEYSSTNRDLFKDYEQGATYCYTGTSGESYETKELASAVILKIPRHLGLNRNDKAINLTQNETGHVNALVNHIIAAWKRSQPVLLLCEDDKSAQALHLALDEVLKGKQPNATSQYVSSQTNPEVLAGQVMQAGQSNMLTVATEKFGRGTDIKLDANSRAGGGLVTLIAYLPTTERELEQMFSRSARFGDPGETRLILNADELKLWLGSSSMKRDFYLEPETFIQRLIARLNRRKQCERVIVDEVNGFRSTLRDTVIRQLYPRASRLVEREGESSQLDRVRGLWAQCLQSMDVKWAEISSDLKGTLDPFNPNIDTINEKLSAYHQAVTEQWTQFQTELNSIGVNLDQVNMVLPSLQLTEKTKNILSPLTPQDMVRPSVVAYSEYDDAHNGRAIIYTKPFVKLRAILRGERNLFADLAAWYRGDGVLWPNIQAWREGKLGDLSFFQALTCYNGTFTQFIMGTDTSTLKTATQRVVRKPDDIEESCSLRELFDKQLSSSYGGILSGLPLDNSVVNGLCFADDDENSSSKQEQHESSAVITPDDSPSSSNGNGLFP